MNHDFDSFGGLTTAFLGSIPKHTCMILSATASAPSPCVCVCIRTVRHHVEVEVVVVLLGRSTGTVHGGLLSA